MVSVGDLIPDSMRKRKKTSSRQRVEIWFFLVGIFQRFKRAGTRVSRLVYHSDRYGQKGVDSALVCIFFFVCGRKRNDGLDGGVAQSGMEGI